MNRLHFVCVLSLCVSPLSHAEEIFKCNTDAGVTYQNQPCTEGTTTLLLRSAPSKPDAQSDTGGVAVVSDQKTPPPPGRATLKGGGELRDGMSDMQVLNNRNWGKPQRITRNREPRAWHETWNYETGANSGKRLHFVNGTLARVEEREPPVEVADKAEIEVIVER